MASITPDDILQLPVEEQIRIVNALWDTVSEEMDESSLSQEQRDELNRRLAAHRSNPNRAIPRAEAIERIRSGS